MYCQIWVYRWVFGNSWQKTGNVVCILPAEIFSPLPSSSSSFLFRSFGSSVSTSSNYSSNWVFLWKQTRRHSTSPLRNYKNMRCTMRKQKVWRIIIQWEKLLLTIRNCTAFNSLTAQGKPGSYWRCQAATQPAVILWGWPWTETGSVVLYCTWNLCRPQVPMRVALYSLCPTVFSIIQDSFAAPLSASIYFDGQCI